MINVGIIGGETEAAGELIRILINHPDVILRTVCSPLHAGERVDRYHRGLTGDTELCFENTLEVSKLNCVFLVGESWQAKEFMTSVNAPSHKLDADDDAEDALRIVDMTGSFINGDYGMVYGFPEYNRKALVRGALRASVPSAIATGVELSLFPLAKNHLLTGAIDSTVKMSRHNNIESATTQADFAASQLSTRLDPVAPVEHRPDAERAAAEIEKVMKEIYHSFVGKLNLKLATDMSPLRGMTVVSDVPCSVNIEEIKRLYEEAYVDHSFAYIIDRLPETADISNTNKCLLNIEPVNGKHSYSSVPIVRITAVLDNLIKGSAGTAVHCMNLLFGLSERTGLALKASVI